MSLGVNAPLRLPFLIQTDGIQTNGGRRHIKKVIPNTDLWINRMCLSRCRLVTYDEYSTLRKAGCRRNLLTTRDIGFSLP